MDHPKFLLMRTSLRARAVAVRRRRGALNQALSNGTRILPKGLDPKSADCQDAALVSRSTRPYGFTLIELLSSMAILSILIMVLVSMVNQTSSIWRYTTAKTEQFREARECYESLTKKLSQATLNTYWDYDNPTKPTKYIRKSELRFISGRKVAQASDRAGWRPTHGVFFCAPLGYVEDGQYPVNNPYRGLDYLLNTWGFFIEYNDDSKLRPPFVKSPNRNRLRLIESMILSQKTNIYTAGVQTSGGTGWIYGDTGGWSPGSGTAHALADNIIALIVLPKLSKADMQKWNAAGGKYDDTSLAPSYNYTSYSSGSRGKDPRLNSTNQLPPVVQVSMVAIDEASAKRMSDADTQELLVKLDTIFKDASKFQMDLYGNPSDADESLTEFLIRKHINYRVFTSDVAIRGAKWSTEQIN